ncbi:hypothetical protein BCR42DRAFT_422624 [Absidia repens]|uniref:Uncharacterized protein n=1 Tax=Absidia repens TaxID=90262 RepID=A0A1X2I6Y8_9FUNG|nr:hypothetical protein BCR42DRAFT_422624 [Absidia repens]
MKMSHAMEIRLVPPVVVAAVGRPVVLVVVAVAVVVSVGRCFLDVFLAFFRDIAVVFPLRYQSPLMLI